MSCPSRYITIKATTAETLEWERLEIYSRKLEMLGAGALRRPRGMVRGGRKEGGSGWGTRVYLWRIHVDVWQNQYNIVK